MKSIKSFAGRSRRRHQRVLALSSVVVALNTATGLAQDPQAPNPIVLPDIVVTATGTPTPTAKVASSVTVITADQIATRQQRTVNDVLNAVPGLNIVQTGGPGGQTSVFMRGTNSNHVKVLIDGIDVSDPSTANGSFDFGQLLTGDIERVEVLRGPQSGLYGSDAIGGVISITTKKGNGPPKVTASVEGGSFGTTNERLGVSGSLAQFYYAFNVDHNRSTNTPVVPDYLKPPSKQARDQSYDNTTVSTRVGADLSDNLSISGLARYTYSTLLLNSDQSGACFCLADANRSKQVDYQFYTREEAAWHSLDNKFKTTLGVAYTNVSTYNAPAPEDFTAPSTNLGERLKFDLKQEIALVEGEKLILGLEHEATNLNTGTANYSVANRGAYAELVSDLFDRFSVASNVRYDNNQAFGDHVTYRVAPSYILPTLDTKLKASLGTGFKAPTLSQLYQSYPSFGFFANPNLKPEQSVGYDFGFEQPILNDRLRFGSTYFHNNITNLITSNSTFTTNINVGRAETYGNESFVSFKVNDQLNLRSDYTFTIAKNQDTGAALLRRPQNKASLQADWTPIDNLRLSGSVLYVSSWIDYNPVTFSSSYKASGYATVNLATSYDVTKQVSVFARADNLFNRRYEDPTGFLHAGLGVYAGVKVTSF